MEKSPRKWLREREYPDAFIGYRHPYGMGRNRRSIPEESESSFFFFRNMMFQ